MKTEPKVMSENITKDLKADSNGERENLAVSPVGSSFPEDCCTQEEPLGDKKCASGETTAEQLLEAGVPQFVMENIPWSPGTVKKQKFNLEERCKLSTHVPETEGHANTQGNTVTQIDNPVVEPVTIDIERDTTRIEPIEAESLDIPESCSDVKDKVIGRELNTELGTPTNNGTPEQQASVYELEDIQVAPGTVKRTTQEIEQRNQ